MEKDNRIWSFFLRLSLIILVLLSIVQFKVKLFREFDDRTLFFSDSMYVDDTKLLDNIVPDTILKSIVRWESRMPSIARIDSLQESIVAFSAGQTELIGSDNENVLVQLRLRVIPVVDNIPISQMAMVEINPTLVPEQELDMHVSVTPINATDQSLDWSSSDPSIVSVDPQTGKCVALKPGEATISASTKDGSNLVVQTVVQVENKFVKTVSINNNPNEINIGDTYTLVAEVSPSNATNKTIIWKSSDERIATITSSGIITGKRDGTCIIFARSAEDEKIFDTAKIVVKHNTSFIGIKALSFENEISLNENDSKRLSVVINPTNATNRNLKWESSDFSVATVKDGTIYAKKTGKCDITAFTTDGSGISKVVKVVVSSKPQVKDLKETLLMSLDILSSSSDFDRKESIANEMKKLFVKNPVITVKSNSFSTPYNLERIDQWASANIVKVSYVSHKIDNRGLITELIVKEEFK